MRLKYALPIAISLALVAEVASTIPAFADKPAPIPSATATAGEAWGGGHREDDSSKTNSQESGMGTTGNSKQTTAQPTIDLAEHVRVCRQFNAVGTTSADNCEPEAPAKKAMTADAPTPTQLREVAAHLKLPNPTPRFGPDPSVNEWKMLAVGFPIWLWTDRPTHLTTTAHHDGLDFTLTATWTSTTFTMGDGHTKTCSATTIRPKQVKPATTPSPTCGYVYQTRSKPGHPYTVTAATHWRIDWATNGYQGSFTHTYTGQRTLDIGELHSLING